MSFIVRNPINFFFSTTGNLLIFFFLNFVRASVISAPGFMVISFLFIMALAGIVFRSFPDFLTTAQTISFFVKSPLRFSFSVISRLPTLFLTIIFAHSFRSVFGGAWM